MGPFMRMQSAIENKIQERDAITKEQRERATSLLRADTKRSEVVRMTKISRATIHRICRALEANDEA